MHCPDCGGEFVDGLSICPDCERTLVPRLAPEDHPDTVFEAVFESADPQHVPMAKSLLDAEGVPYILQGETMQGMLPVQAASGFFGPHGLGAIFHVPSDRAEEAREILAPLREASIPNDDEE